MTEADWFVDFEQMRHQVEQVIQIFHMERTLNEIARSSPETWHAINRCGAFWGTHRNCLDTTLFIVMGRLFDKSGGATSLRSFLKATAEHPGFFTKSALRTRKIGQGVLHKWLDGCVEGAWVYAPLRNRVYAHIQEKDRNRIDELYSQTRYDEVEGMLRFLKGVIDDLWELYVNGHEFGTLGSSYESFVNRVQTEARLVMEQITRAEATAS